MSYLRQHFPHRDRLRVHGLRLRDDGLRRRDGLYVSSSAVTAEQCELQSHTDSRLTLARIVSSCWAETVSREHAFRSRVTSASKAAYPECALSVSRGTIMSMSMHTTPSSCATCGLPESPMPSSPPLHEFSAVALVLLKAATHAASSFFLEKMSVYSVHRVWHGASDGASTW